VRPLSAERILLASLTIIILFVWVEGENGNAGSYLFRVSVLCYYYRQSQYCLEAVMRDLPSFNVAYDRDSDVLYISARKVPAYRGVEDAQGIVWRYDRNGELIGMTVVDFYDRWYSNRPELTRKISAAFDIPELQAETVLNHAIENLRGL
jgi:uncharacterized protein YuzE